MKNDEIRAVIDEMSFEERGKVLNIIAKALFGAADDEEKPDKPRKRVVKHQFGTHKNVLLTDEEYEKLKIRFADYQEKIDNLSNYLSYKKVSYKSHYNTILVWAQKDEKKASCNAKQFNNPGYYEGMKL